MNLFLTNSFTMYKLLKKKTSVTQTLTKSHVHSQVNIIIARSFSQSVLSTVRTSNRYQVNTHSTMGPKSEKSVISWKDLDCKWLYYDIHYCKNNINFYGNWANKSCTPVIIAMFIHFQPTMKPYIKFCIEEGGDRGNLVKSPLNPPKFVFLGGGLAPPPSPI